MRPISSPPGTDCLYQTDDRHAQRQPEQCHPVRQLAQRQGTAGPDFRLEMEGLQYSEIPMLAGSNPALMQQALSAVRNDYSLARLYAMGADAWSLANHFTQMRQTPGFELNGNTGDLTATRTA
jgi:outer membrane PBP1 activator LpoA protein